MGEYAAKFRPEVDLDEFERRLRAAAPAPQPRPEEAADPLAELARLVNGEGMAGRSDPFESLFRAQTAVAEGRRAAQSRSAAAQPQIAPYGLREPYFEQPPHGEDYAGAEAPAAQGGHAHPDEAYAYPDERYAADPLPYQESEPAWAETSGAAEQPAWPAAFSEAAPPEPAPRIRRKVMYGMAAVLALGVAGIAGVLALRGHSGSREVVTIEPDRDPARVKPAQVENATPEGQALFDRKGGNNVSKVVANAEQPADLKTAVKNAPAGAAGVATPTPPAPSAGGAQTDSLFPPPKKVKTIAVRADGSVIGGPEAPVPVPMTRTLPTMAAGAPEPDVAPAPPRRSAEKSTQRAAALTESASKPSAHSRPAKVEAARETAGQGGGYAVQLAGTPSESAARAAAKRLSAKYSSALAGHQASYVQAKIGAKTIWRVRVNHLAEDKAKSICEAVKAQGGRCFVARD
ncbi:SPOR domain-containing protein [Rhodoblastus acidophilus]|uniref:SPOR domain-containing protein n=1 Tax=Candidatus Rhodoblastus alkanivorans TaxID=2954117 RepID=A0ABS9Z9D4_9HYPH|nr:SPOR domain-containing protein [Candidatus Rhodoblastus alkanivorans]MCI4679995.1 SPOR domain-containing protein [Candidatus Rhodoblastus alkanivorans]MCI4684263.1 SPOR domain-containing protein [Candidatus Rhodoblastus alkanivorans]MDI4641583.1 SPOR domain-containing protein [Rhodoblastus acidophilus]